MSNNVLDIQRHHYPISNEVPNEETRAAIEELRSGKPLEVIPAECMQSFEAFMDYVNKL